MVEIVASDAALAHDYRLLTSMPGGGLLLACTLIALLQHLPKDEAWLIGEDRMSGEKKYYLVNLPANTDLRTLAATISAAARKRAI